MNEIHANPSTDAGPDPQVLVARLASKDQREAAFAELVAMGPPARFAIREGLRHANWQVRRWCAIWLDHHADAESLQALIPLLHDPKSQVRLFAVHSLACEQCKAGENPIDVVPLLIERIHHDESIRVRRHATMMLSFQYAHPDLEGFFAQLLETETDPKLHKHAGIGWFLCRKQAGKPIPGL